MSKQPEPQALMISLNDHKVGQAALLEHIESLKAAALRSEAHRNELADKIVDQRTTIGALTAERDGLLAEVERLTKAEDNQRARVGRAHALLDEQRSELTKARELLEEPFQLVFEIYNSPGDRFVSDQAWASWQHATAIKAFSLLQNLRRELNGHQSAPVAKCARCDASTVERCDDKGCGFFDAGKGASAAKGEPPCSS